jgi:hypothetical protein
MPITRQQHRRQLQNHTGVNGVIATTSVLVNMDQLPGPGTFSGRPDENGKNWLDRFELWASRKGYNDDIKKAALALYLQESAATWLQVLPDVEKDTFAHLRTSFQKRYRPSQQAGWQRASQLWTLQQEAGESSLDFIAKIQRAARDINMTEELQCFAVINGLRPAIRAHVLRQNPGDIAALRQAAVIAEQTEPPVSTTDDRLARIEHQLQLLTVNVFERDRQHEPSSPDRCTAPSNNRGSSASRSPLRESAARRQLSPMPPHCYDRAAYGASSRRQYPEATATERRVVFDDEYPRQQSGENRQQQQPSPRRSSSACASCGRSNHYRSDCYFRQAVCTHCHKVGHIAQACRSSRR